MTTLTKTVLSVRTAELCGTSTLPILYDVQKPDPDGEGTVTNLSEDDGLWVDYAPVLSAFPYKAQDQYTRELTGDGMDCYVLENEFLKATFVPEAGGKLWSLYDKSAGKELLFANHVFRPAYLALRNAWTSGGVEWNCGARPGHHPYTCSPLFTAVLSSEESGLGCPVLRFYSYERIREITHQMDFYLPEGAHFLHCRMRIVNDNYRAAGVYWWSNIAVPTNEIARCVVPADYAYTPVDGKISCVPVQNFNGIDDVTYPTRSPIAVDYFFKTYENHRHYTSHLDENGYGLVQTSTARLKGRKLFVWGQGQGGERWQELLSGDDGQGRYQDGKYCEIQCGLGSSQYEILPMPPKTAWEWIEYYGPMTADPKKIHGAWKDAQAELEARLDKAAPLSAMEEELTATRTMAHTAAKPVLYGEGWAALENMRRTAKDLPPICPHLDFGTPGKDQRMWEHLLHTGSLKDGSNDNEAPLSYQKSSPWLRLLEKAAAGVDADYWKTHYMLGCAYLSDGETERAKKAADNSLRCEVNAWNTYLRAEIYRAEGKKTEAAGAALTAARLQPENTDLCRRAAAMLIDAGMWQDVLSFADFLPETIRDLPRLRLCRAIAAEKTDDLPLAAALLYGEDGTDPLVIPDIQEGEVAITSLWFDLEEKRARAEGRPFDRNTAKPPKNFDFRMNSAE